MLSFFNVCIQFQQPFRIMFCAELCFIEQALNLQYTNISQSNLRKGTYFGKRRYKRNALQCQIACVCFKGTLSGTLSNEDIHLLHHCLSLITAVVRMPAGAYDKIASAGYSVRKSDENRNSKSKSYIPILPSILVSIYRLKVVTLKSSM